MISTGSVQAIYFENSNKPSSFITGGKFLDKMSNYQLFKNDSALLSKRVNMRELRRVFKYA